MSTHNDGDVKDHVGYFARPVDPEGDDQLAKCRTEGVCEACHSRRGHSAPVGEPKVGISSRCRKDEWLCKAIEDLAKHHYPKQSLGTGMRARKANPVSNKDEGGRRDDGLLGTQM